jgi:acyl-coenzyme A synthetase/AMP-(fatty) acid ligase/uncharacterized membrane protein
VKTTLAGGLRGAAIALGVLGYALLAYYSTTPQAARNTPMLGLATSLAPTLALLVWLAWQSTRRSLMLVLSGLLIGSIWHYRAALALHFDWIYLIQHAGTNALLAVAFGATLARGRQPLCTRLAEGVRGALTPEVIRYTRQVTLAWTLFFVATSVLSCLLFVLAPLTTWAIFANFLTLPLVVLMFAVEYRIRLAKLPDERRYGILKSVMAYWNSGKETAAPDNPAAAQTLPLVAYPSLDSVLAYRNGRPIAVRQFLDEVWQLAERLPEGRHVLNLCVDRYRFTVGLAACIVTGRVSLLPSTHTPEMLRQMQQIAPDVFCIADQEDDSIALPTFRYPEQFELGGSTGSVPRIPADQLIAQVFTSGSTGLPLPHAKHWGSLVRSARAEAARLGLTTGHSVVGTVPAQHMYGLESTVMQILQSGAALHAARPFYPADIQAALAELPRPRALVTTPYHLRTLLNADLELPAVDLILSATAPLADDLAREAETRLAAPLYEIYGCTETGQLASRRTTAGPEWQLLADVGLHREADRIWAIGGHVEDKTYLNDTLELTGPDRFKLGGRNGDLVNIAGKRTSLGYLNHQLNAIPGVRDGIFMLPRDDGPDGIGRLTALVVAPTLTPDELMQALRERIDPVFLPRPLLFVDELPRNATGKLPANLAQDLLSSVMTRECASA